MDRRVKLALDIIVGAVIPLLILNNLNELLGTLTTYVVAALVPVAWILFDTCFLSRRFNFITSYVGMFAILRGLLAFWFVDGIQFAFKDSISSIFAVLVFGLSIMLGKPIMYYFLMQGMSPESSAQERSLKALLAESKVYGALVKSTKILLLISLVTGVTNFLLNLQIVVADFGTIAFNQQVAQVNAMTQVMFSILESVGVAIAVVLIRRAMYYYLSKEEGKEQDESDFWDLLQLRDRQQLAADS